MNGALGRFASRVRSQVRAANASHGSGTDGEPEPQSARPEAARLRRLGWLRRPSARDRSRWARRALDWPLVNYLEGAVWLGVGITLGVSYYGSYDNLVDVLTALGYAAGPAHAVPIALDAPLTVSVIGQFLLARWKSPAVRRWRLFAVTVITAPLTLAGNALHGALRFAPGARGPLLDLGLLDLHRPEVVIRLVAAMVPAIGVILAVAVTELVLRERARLEELRETNEPEDSPPRSQEAPPTARLADPRVVRVALAGGDWKRVATATGLGEHAAKRALTAARKQIAAESRDESRSLADGYPEQDRRPLLARE